jgi:hypothetical protein
MSGFQDFDWALLQMEQGRQVQRHAWRKHKRYLMLHDAGGLGGTVYPLFVLVRDESDRTPWFPVPGDFTTVDWILA